MGSSHRQVGLGHETLARRLLCSGALHRVGDHSLPKRVMSGELENAGKHGPGGEEK